jgi:uncharacterized integral membrane protein
MSMFYSIIGATVGGALIMMFIGWAVLKIASFLTEDEDHSKPAS